MAELLTNGTLDSDLSGWTTETSNPTPPGSGPASAGQVVFIAAPGGGLGSGGVRFRSETDPAVNFEGALSQSVGVLTPGEAYTLVFTCYRTLAALTDDGRTRAQIYFGLVGTPHLAASVHSHADVLSNPAHPTPYLELSPITAPNGWVADSVSFDVSHFVTAGGAGEYALYVVGSLTSGTGGERSFCDFDAVSLDGIAAPASGRTYHVATAVLDRSSSVEVCL